MQPTLFDCQNVPKVQNLRNVLLNDLFKAYYDARRNKRNTINQLNFELGFESSLFELCDEIINRTYEISAGICFINYRPVQREIFAADFRDRVVHHLIYNYISPVFERVFIHDAYSCRKGKGTSYGIKRLEHFIRSCSDNYKYDCYILKLDIKGYFMAMNRQILYDKVLATLKSSEGLKPSELYRTIVYLIEKVIFNDPTKNCIVKGKQSDWNGLPASKSLFHANANCGLPIGNLPSQLFGNVYLNDFDHFVKGTLRCKHYGRYVDDFVIVHRDKEYLKDLIPQLSNFLHSTLQLTLHPKKIYLQHYTKGVEFLGAIIKPHRKYIKNRTKGNFYKAFDSWKNFAENHPDKHLSKPQTQAFVSCINSYLGLCRQYNSYKLREKIICKNMNSELWKNVYLEENKRLIMKRFIR